MESNADAPREVEAAVQKALETAGIQGRVHLGGRTLTLHTAGAAVEIDALYLVEQWALLPPDLRERKASDVAMRLIDANAAAGTGAASEAAVRATSGAPPGVSARPERVSARPEEGATRPLAPSVRPYVPSGRPFVPSARPTGAPAAGGGRPISLPIGAIVVLGSAITLGVLYVLGRAPSPPSGSTTATATATATATGESADARNGRLCEAARARVLSTGTLAQIDAEVWIAELWLASSKSADPAHAKGIEALVQQGKLTASADPDLASVPIGSVEIAADDKGSEAGYHAVRVQFRGGYVSQFFDAAGRERMNRVAGKFADATSADIGALYGRCAHLKHHDIGAWFRGASPAHAGTALVYAMGLFSERRLTNRDPSATPTLADIGPLFTALGKVDNKALESAVRDAGGTFAAGAAPGDPTTITFPMGGPTRAARATGSVATSAGIGPDSPRTGAAP